MTISLVQSKSIINPGSAAGSFTSTTTSGNCVVVLLFTYASTNVVISTSAVTLGGAADNFAQAAFAQSAFASSDTQYIGAWVDPNCAGGKTAVAATVTNGTWINGAGLILMEFSGVTSGYPADDPFNAFNTATTGTAISTGTATGTAFPNEMVIGAAYPDNGVTAESGSFTNILLGSSSPYTGTAGYTALASAGSTLAYTATGGSSGVWVALEIALVPATGFRAGRPLVVSQAVNRASTY